MLPLFLIGYAASIFYASGADEGESFGGSKKGGGKSKNKEEGRKSRGDKKKRRRGKQGQEGEGEDSSQEGGEEGEEIDPLERANEQIDLEFDLDQIGDDVASRMFFDEDDEDDDLDDEDDEEFGAFPGGPPSGAQVLQSAGLAQPGSWTERNVLQAGARDSWSRRVAGNATEADFAVLRAARPGIASSASGPISPAWTKARWPGTGGAGSGGPSIEDAVLEEMGL